MPLLHIHIIHMHHHHHNIITNNSLSFFLSHSAPCFVCCSNRETRNKNEPPFFVFVYTLMHTRLERISSNTTFEEGWSCMSQPQQKSYFSLDSLTQQESCYLKLNHDGYNNRQTYCVYYTIRSFFLTVLSTIFSCCIVYVCVESAPLSLAIPIYKKEYTGKRVDWIVSYKVSVNEENIFCNN